MSVFERWLKQPQRVFLRRALFQVHLWTGLIIGLYLIAVSVSGSAIVFREEIIKRYATDEIRIEPTGGEVLPKEVMKAAAVKAHPGYVVTFVFPKGNDAPTEIWMEDKGGEQIQWLFNPYTGSDMGTARPEILKWLAWFGQLHGNLLMEGDGLTWNGVGGILLCLLCATGIVIWWPGIANWKRNLLVHGGVGWRRFNWDLHNAVGFWTMLLVLMWGFTGAYFVFPDPVRAVINQFAPIDPPPLPRSTVDARATNPPPSPFNADGTPRPRPRRPRRPQTTGQKILRSFSYLHYGNFAGWPVKALWAFLGLVPPMLFLTGALMWWNRKIAPALKRR